MLLAIYELIIIRLVQRHLQGKVLKVKRGTLNPEAP